MPTKKEDLKWYTLEEVFAKAEKKKGFREAYAAEHARLEMIRRLREQRAAKRMTQKAVAQKADMPQSVIARAESGSRDMTMETLIRIAHAVGKRVQLV